ncbi:MAG: hypothetical protein MRQ07_05215 [Candidatus Midichloria sp.]|nr:hypothetical protein [Candidatus Midichloria sp.]
MRLPGPQHNFVTIDGYVDDVDDDSPNIHPCGTTVQVNFCPCLYKEYTTNALSFDLNGNNTIIDGSGV